MTGFLDAVLAFPTALFSFLLLVAIGYSVVFLFGLVDGVGRPHRHRQPPTTHFVGRPCVVCTGEVSPEFGQAEVTDDDGCTAIIQVRLTGYAIGAGWVGLIYDYDAEIGAFWITPAEPAV